MRVSCVTQIESLVPAHVRKPNRTAPTKERRIALLVALLGGHLKSWIDSYGYEAVFTLVGLESIRPAAPR